MPLPAGLRLGPYEITSALGSGGMGEVYRARDTRLDRTVAIKILPAAHADDAEHRRRFEREARAVAALNHPHICAVYDVGRHDATDYLVMELVDGQTLASRLEKGALPLDEALRYAIQIADALSQAHRAGIVHRDLKPANVMVTKTGVKLLDFGLAKATSAALATAGQTALPTTPANVTMQGTILGTLQYMAPEQVEGGEADARSDIFAFGAVLYEMVTGRRAFEGKSAASLMGAILKDHPPPLSALEPLTPRALDHIVATCLAKDPDDRWQDARDLGRELRWVADPANRTGDSVPAGVAGRAGRAIGLRWSGIAALVGGALALGGALGWILVRPAPPVAAVTRWSIPNERGAPPPVQISRDGRLILHFGEGSDGVTRVNVRRFDQLDSTIVRGTERAIAAALSPDGASVAFVADAQLKRVPIAGGPPSVICPASLSTLSLDWAPGDVIVFDSEDGLHRVAAAGGRPARLTSLDASKELAHSYPTVLADGATVLFAARQGTGEQVAWVPLAGGAHAVLLPGGRPRVTPAGHLLFRRGTTLFGVRLDVTRKQIVGEPVPLLENVTSMLNGYMAYDVSDDGTLIYRPRRTERLQVSWVSRDGRTSVAVAEQLDGQYHGPPALSPDGRRLAVTVHPRNGEDQIVVYDLERGIRTPLGAMQGLVSRFPVWTPDGGHLTFASTRDGTWDIFEVPATNLGEAPKPLVGGPGTQWPTSWSPDGQVLAFHSGVTGPPVIWTYRRNGAAARLVETPEPEGPAVFSPDGRWLAYDSDASGRPEVYIRPASGQGDRIQVSTNGGRNPIWRGNSPEIFYLAGNDAMMAVGGRFTPVPVLTTPTELFRVHLFAESTRAFTVTPDGQRFVVLQDLNTTPDSIVVVQHWFQELAKTLR